MWSLNTFKFSKDFVFIGLYETKREGENVW